MQKSYDHLSSVDMVKIRKQAASEFQIAVDRADYLGMRLNEIDLEMERRNLEKEK